MTEMKAHGIHTIHAILTHHPDRVTELYCMKDRNDKRINKIIELAKRFNIPIIISTKEQLTELSGTKSHQGVFATFTAPQYSEANLPELIEQSGSNTLILILDCIQDPHNLGACLRSADAAGVNFVIAPKNRSASITPTVRKVASGAADVLPFIQVTNLARTLRLLKEQGIFLVGAAGEAKQPLYDVDMTGNVALVIGSEGEGLRELTKKHCDFLVNIPMLGTVDSLNASVATGVCLYEAVRQRTK